MARVMAAVGHDRPVGVIGIPKKGGEALLAAARRLEVGEIELHLRRASVALSRHDLLDRLLAPLLQRIGDLWHRGEMRPAHEHVVSAVVALNSCRTWKPVPSNAMRNTTPRPFAPPCEVVP